MTDKQVLADLQKLGGALNQLLEPFQPLIQLLQQFSKAISPFVEAIASQIEHFVKYDQFLKAVQPTGWLPYHTVSIDFVEACGDDVALLESRLTEFYEKNWKTIRQDIDTRLDHYQITTESKTTLREALSAHEAGHYRCVCRVLFPEIDREFRIHFFEDAAGSISSKKMLEKLTDQGALEYFLPREAYGWILFDRLVHHLYEPVNDNNRVLYEKDFVPNRHASTHGLVSYSTFKHSMNMIIMADYVFQVLTSTAKLTSSQ